MKKSILFTILMTILANNNVQGRSCCQKKTKISHTNRKIKSCDATKKNCGAKYVRVNRFAKKKCCPL